MLGDKAAKLRILKENGLLVPEFYVIGADALNKLSKPEFAKKIMDSYIEWSSKNHCESVAVRSSAEGEDSKEQSFAGQYHSVMDVSSKDQFLIALEKVSKSKPSVVYSTKKAKVNVIVQRYIKPDVAGVLFTVDPSNGRNEMTANAALGHGSSVVGGNDAQTIKVDRVTGNITNRNKYPVLSNRQIRELQVAGEKIESIMRYPQDIEWAFFKNDLYILQTRPITRIAHLQVWDNANIGESFPGIVSPLTFSISRRGYELVYKSQSYEAGLNWYQLEGNHRTFNSMVGLFAGRMYYNLANWYKFIGLFPNNSQNQKYLDEQLQTVGDAIYLPPSHYPLVYKLKFYLRVIRRTIFFEREKKNYWRFLENNFKQYEKLSVGEDLFILLDRYSFIEQRIIPNMGRSADNDFFVMIYHGILKARLGRWLGNDKGSTTDFIGALHDVISARQANILSEIAQFINRDKKAERLMQSHKYQELDEYLLSSDVGKAIKEYRDKFLHRFAEDQKIEAKNQLTSLSGFYKLIGSYQKLNNNDVQKRQAKALEAERRRSDGIIQQISYPRKLFYILLLKRLKHHLRIREHNRLLRGKAYAYLRSLFIEIGIVLKGEGLINEPSDVYFLDIEEIFRLVNATGYSDDIKLIIESRKKQYKSYKNLKAPSRFITTGIIDGLPFSPSSKDNITRKTLDYLEGTISSPGTIEGKVIVLDKPVIPKEPFDILVVSHTDPGWTPLIALSRGLIIEHGGILSHAAIVTRELGIPSIIGVENATAILKSGMKVRINTAKSAVEII